MVMMPANQFTLQGISFFLYGVVYNQQAPSPLYALLITDLTNLIPIVFLNLSPLSIKNKLSCHD